MPPATGDHTEYSGGAHGSETGVGAMLRTARMRLGEDLRSVAQMLCIRYPYLEAIEEGRFKELPGQTYAIGFIRAYSDHLGLDSDEVIRRYKVETAASARGQELSFPTPVPETGIPGGAIVFVGIVVALIAYGAWYISTSENNILADLVSPVPERLAEQTEGAEQGTPSSEPEQPTETAEPAAPPKPEEPAASAEPATTETPATTAAPVEAPDEQTAEPDQSVAEPSQDAAGEPEAAEPEQTATEADTPAVAEQPAEQAAVETEAAGGSEPSQDAAETASPSPASSEPEETAAPEAVIQTAPEPESQAVEPAAASDEDASPEDQTTENLPAGTAQSVPAEDTQPTAEVSQAEETDQPAPADEAGSTGAETASVSESESETAPEAVPAPPAVAPSVETSVASTSGPRIVLMAKTSSWIQVRDDAANQMLVTRLLRADETYEVPDRPGLKLLTGNAGALEVVVDGQVAPSIGDIGVVRRGVVLDAERLLAGTAVDN